ncbi:12018_t:CDS:2 [Entrophospora sp. SA101]|nr:12018_t:CDS:2 [Entrophospora sp. SA101]
MTTPKYFDPWARREAWRNQFGFRNNVRLSWPGLSWGIGAFIIYLGYETLANQGGEEGMSKYFESKGVKNFMNQFSSGKSFSRGTDKDGRPIW